MKIEPLATHNVKEGVICPALAGHSDEFYNNLKAWLDGNRLRGRFARMENGDVAGFVLYYPIEQAPMDVDGKGLYMVQCLYIKPEYQDLGVGRELIESAIADARDNGALGFGAEWFAHQDSHFHFMPETDPDEMGMQAVESRGDGTLYYVAFSGKSQPPRYLHPKYAPPGGSDGRIRVDLLDCKRCCTSLTNRDIVKTVLNQIAEDKIELVVHDQNSREAILAKGVSSGVFIDGRLTYFTGPVTEDDIWDAIEVAQSARKMAVDR